MSYFKYMSYYSGVKIKNVKTLKHQLVNQLQYHTMSKIGRRRGFIVLGKSMAYSFIDVFIKKGLSEIEKNAHKIATFRMVNYFANEKAFHNDFVKRIIVTIYSFVKKHKVIDKMYDHLNREQQLEVTNGIIKHGVSFFDRPLSFDDSYGFNRFKNHRKKSCKRKLDLFFSQSVRT